MNCAWEEGLSYIELECPQGVAAIPAAVIILDKHNCTEQDCPGSARCQTCYNAGIIFTVVRIVTVTGFPELP